MLLPGTHKGPLHTNQSMWEEEKNNQKEFPSCHLDELQKKAEKLLSLLKNRHPKSMKWSSKMVEEIFWMKHFSRFLLGDNKH